MFYGIRSETENKDGASSSSLPNVNTSAATTTRKHVLQVSTYQVKSYRNLLTLLVINFLKCDFFFSLDVCFNAI